MSSEIVGFIGIIFLVVLLGLRMPVGFSMLMTGLLGCIYFTTIKAGLSKLGIEAYASSTIYGLSVIPLFMLMGQFLSYSGLAGDIYRAVNTWLGRIRGGLAMGTVGACTLFGAVCGSVIATAATIASVAFPEMKRYGYKDSFSAACIAGSAGLGILIPPSTILVLYGILTLEPIGKLLIAGILPGILQALLFIITIYIQVKLNPRLAPPLGQSRNVLGERLKQTAKIYPVLALFILVILGIYFGVFSPTEGGAVGAFLALIFSLSKRRLNWDGIKNAMEEATRVTAMIFLIIIGANIFGTFMAMTKIPTQVVEFVTSLGLSKYVILAAIYLFYIILGTFMEGIAILVLTIPIIYPLIKSLGFSGIWFGVIMVIMLNIGTVTPPVGIIVYVTAGIAKEVPMESIFKDAVPMWLAMIACAIILTAFPEVATFLVSLMR